MSRADERRLQKLQQAHELREHQHLVTLGEQRLEDLDQRLELAGAEARVAAGERGMAADLAQARERREHGDLVALHAAGRGGERLDERPAAPELGEIELPLPLVSSQSRRSSMRGGSSGATARLVRRSSTGRSFALKSERACGGASRTSKRSLNSARGSRGSRGSRRRRCSRGRGRGSRAACR